MAGLNLEIVINDVVDFMSRLRACIRNPALLRRASVASLLDQKLELLLPKNAHELCSGRLGIALTKMWTFENKLVSQYKTRQELIDAVLAGCFIPGWSGTFTLPEYKGEKFVDGGFSNNSPRFSEEKMQDENTSSGRYLRICAFACEGADVSPKDTPTFGLLSCFMPKFNHFGNTYILSWKNLVRGFHAMMPANVETYLHYLACGHRDMKEYLFKNDLLKCRGCYSEKNFNTTTVIGKEACLACLQLLEKVDSLTIPKNIIDMLKE